MRLYCDAREYNYQWIFHSEAMHGYIDSIQGDNNIKFISKGIKSIILRTDEYTLTVLCTRIGIQPSQTQNASIHYIQSGLKNIIMRREKRREGKKIKE